MGIKKFRGKIRENRKVKKQGKRKNLLSKYTLTEKFSFKKFLKIQEQDAGVSPKEKKKKMNKTIILSFKLNQIRFDHILTGQ